MGYSLTPDTSEQKMIFMLGSKRSGKGTIMRVLGRLMAGQTVSMNVRRLETTNALQSAIGKYVMTMPDLRISKHMNTTAIVETMLSVSGEDEQTVFRKYLEDWTGYILTKIWIASNPFPKLEDPSGTIASRFQFIWLPKSFYDKPNKKLTHEIWVDADAFLAWTVGHWRKLKERGSFTETKSHEHLATKMEAKQNPLAPLLQDRIEVTGDTNDLIIADHAYLSFMDCVAQYGITGFTKTGVTRALNDHEPPVLKKRRNVELDTGQTEQRYCYVGVRWREGREPDLNQIMNWSREHENEKDRERE